MGQQDGRRGKKPSQDFGFEDGPQQRTGSMRPLGGAGGVVPKKQPETRPTRSTTGQMAPLGGAPKTTTGQMPAQQGQPPPASSPPASKVSGPMAMTDFQKQQLGSAFGDAKGTRQRNTFFGTDPGRRMAPEDDPTAPAAKQLHHFDGQTAPQELTLRDLWKAVQAPVQSRPGRRSRDVYEQVLKQFALPTNPRYADDAPGRTRAHIFVWDVSRAMNCEIPHFVGAKELNLAQTCDWIRHEGPMRGWLRTGEMEAFDLVNHGQMVLAMPKDPRTKQLAIVFPQPMNDDGVPLLAGAGLKRGWGLSASELFDVRQVEYFTHL